MRRGDLAQLLLTEKLKVSFSNYVHCDSVTERAKPGLQPLSGI
jgi:hypothetical protein